MNWLKHKRFIFISLLCLFSGFMVNNLFAQKIAFKTNALTWTTLSPNVGAELIMSSHFSFNIHATYRPFEIKDKPFRFFIFQPEFRYWLGRPLARHFIGLGAFYLDNNIEFNKKRYKGDGVAAGLSYGYSWVLSKHWNLEASLGAGMMYTRQFKYAIGEEMPEKVNYTKWLPVPMKCSVSIVYLLK